MTSSWVQLVQRNGKSDRWSVNRVLLLLSIYDLYAVDCKRQWVPLLADDRSR
uniref:Uncharacterized protein n=1 Tax=Anopheles minimus TaxID=112268 RepID=A0A182WNW3_9DIPT